MDLHDGDQRGIQVIALGLLRIEDLDRERSTGNGENGTAVEVLGELFGIEGGGSDDDLEVWAPLDGLCDVTGFSIAQK
jgi:hypothetical protein